MELLISVVIGVLIVEGYAWLPTISKWLVNLAVRRLPTEYQERYREEWTAHLDDLPNTLVRLIHALSLNCRRVANEIKIDLFEARCDEAEYELDQLYNSHHEILNAMGYLKAQATGQIDSVKLFFDTELPELLSALGESKGSHDHAQQQMLSEHLQTSVKSVAKFSSTLRKALTRVYEITEVQIERLSNMVEQADGRIERFLEKHARTIQLLRKGRLTPKDDPALRDFIGELAILKSSVADDPSEEDDALRKERDNILTALQNVIHSCGHQRNQSGK